MIVANYLAAGVLFCLGLLTVLGRRDLIKIVLDTRTMKGNQDLFGGSMPAACLYAQPALMTKTPNTAQALATAIVRADEWLQTAAPADVAATVPPAYLLGDKAIYEKAFANVRETISPDGMMPPDGPKNCLKFLSDGDPKIAAAGRKCDGGDVYRRFLIECRNGADLPRTETEEADLLPLAVLARQEEDAVADHAPRPEDAVVRFQLLHRLLGATVSGHIPKTRFAADLRVVDELPVGRRPGFEASVVRDLDRGAARREIGDHLFGDARRKGADAVDDHAVIAREDDRAASVEAPSSTVLLPKNMESSIMPMIMRNIGNATNENSMAVTPSSFFR